MKFIKIAIFSFLFFNQVYSQGGGKGWVIGIGLNAIDDDGKQLKDLFNFSSGWNAVPFPNSFSFENYIKPSFSVELTESINTYAVGNYVDGAKISRSMFFMALDLNAKYHFNTLYKKAEWFDPYVAPGIGLTVRGKNTVPTGNFGFGSTFWISGKIGINIQSIAKFSFTSFGSNYLQHSIGVRFKY